MLVFLLMVAGLLSFAVYLATGGHAYGWVYLGPMGSVLTPQLIGIEQGWPLPNASTFCGRCE